MQYYSPPTPYYTPGSSPSMIMSNETSSPGSDSSDLWTGTLGGSSATTAFISSTPPSTPPSEPVESSASSTKQRPRYAGVQGTTPSPSSSSQQDTVHPSSSARIASNRQARRKDNEPKGPPRPPNAFMLYRSHFLKNLKIPPHVLCQQQHLSMIAGELWRTLPEAERNLWKEKARERARLHLLDNPGYVYKPGPKSKKTKDVGGKTPKEVAIELARQYYPEYEGPAKATTPRKRKADSSSPKTDSSSPRKKRRAADAILPPSLPPSRPASAIAQPGKYPSLGRISPEFRSLPTTPSMRPSSHTASAMEYATMSNGSSPLIHSPLRLPPRATQSNGHEQSVSRISTPEKTDTEATLASVNYDSMFLAQAPYEMNSHYTSSFIPSLPMMPDPLFTQLGMDELAPTAAPIYHGSPSAFKYPQAHATMFGLPYIAARHSSAVPQPLDSSSDFMPIFDTMGNSYGSYGRDVSFGFDYESYGRTEDVIATKADKRD